jgi:uncharacterized small protein (DUF1192 family)
MNLTWNTLENIKFFNYLYKRYSDEEIVKNISEVKEAFKDFFDPIGTILFRYSNDNKIKFKIFSYRVEPKDSKHLKNIINIINKNQKAIVYPYKNQTDQIAITGSIRRKINLEINSTEESINKKELIKYAIRKALELGDRDVIVQLKRMYLVKIFQTNKVTKKSQTESIKPLERKGAENRYNGYTLEEIEESYDVIFNSVSFEHFFDPVMKILFLGKLNFSDMTNKYYEENALKIIQTQIAKELSNYLSLENDYIVGLAGYIFRENFYQVHELIAIELLEQIFHKNKNAELFLEYYTGEVILENNRKYRIPSLETSDGKKWNNSSVLGLSALWINTKNKIKKHKEKLSEVDEQIEYAEEGNTSSVISMQELQTKLTQLKDELNKTKEELKNKAKLLSQYADEGLKFSSKENQIKIEIVKDEKKIQKLKNLISENNKKLQKFNKSNIELNSYKEHHKKLQNDIHAYGINIDSNIGRVHLILESLTNALMSRKKAC